MGSPQPADRMKGAPIIAPGYRVGNDVYSLRRSHVSFAAGPLARGQSLSASYVRPRARWREIKGTGWSRREADRRARRDIGGRHRARLMFGL